MRITVGMWYKTTSFQHFQTCNICFITASIDTFKVIQFKTILSSKRKSVCSVSLSPRKDIGAVIISDCTCADRYVYSFEGRRWRKQSGLILSEREKEILQLSVKGLSNKEIGETLFIDANTVKYHKKKLFENLHAENITEAVGIAANLRLI